MQDFFDRVKIIKPSKVLKCDTCVFSVASPGYEQLLDDMLLSVKVNGGIDNAQLVLFLVNPNDQLMNIARKYNAYPILCCADQTNIDTKSVIYNIIDIVLAKKYIYLDTDVLVLQSLEPLLHLLDKIPPDNICMCRDQYFSWANNLLEAHTGTLYAGKSDDFKYLLKYRSDNIDELQDYPDIINAGVFACSYQALAKLYHTILSFYNVPKWARDGFIREQFLVNLSLAVNNSLTILHPKYNWQMAVRTILKYERNSIGQFDVKIGYNPFFLDYLPDPVAILKKVANTNDRMSSYLWANINNENHKKILERINDSNYTRIEYIKILEDVFNEIIINLELFNNTFLQQFGSMFTDTLIHSSDKTYERVRINKKIISRYYLDEQNDCDYKFNFDDSICILHFNGQYKNINNLRTVIKEQMLAKQESNEITSKQSYKKSDIRIVISTNKNYEETTMPLLLDSLIRVNQIPKEAILIVSGGWDDNTSSVKECIEYHQVTHNSFDHTGIIDIIENDIYSKYWFSMQDTCAVGRRFYQKLLDASDMYDYISVDGQGYLNMGLFSFEFLKSIEPYILSLKNCDKEKAMLSEKMYMSLGKASSFGDTYPAFVGYSDIYGTGVIRNICYYENIDLYKYQANMIETFRICNP